MAKTSLLIAFVHGLFGWGEDEMPAADHQQLRGYWNGIPQFIEVELTSCSEIQAKIIIPSLPSVDSIEVRGAILQRKINQALDVCPEGTRAHLIAHSRGGTDARWVIVQPGMAEKIASLTTIGTAHRGTTFMSWAYAFLPLFHIGGKLLRLIENLKRRLGMSSSEFYYHFLQGYDSSAQQLKRALYPLTLNGAAQFNASLAEQEGLQRTRSRHPIMYRAYGGRVARVHLPFLKVSHIILTWLGTKDDRRSGNDGATSVWSAHYPWDGDGGYYMATVDLDHYEQVNWKRLVHESDVSLPQPLQELYRDIIQRILHSNNT